MCLFLGAAAAAGAGGMMTGVLGAVMGVAQMGLGIMQAQQQSAAAKARYQQEVQFRKQQEIQTQKTLNLQVAQQQMALQSQNRDIQNQMEEDAIKTAQTRGRIDASTAESGAVGQSIAFLEQANEGASARRMNKYEGNAMMAKANAQNSLLMAQRGGAAQLASTPIPVKPANTFGLDAAGAILSGVGTFLNYQT